MLQWDVPEDEKREPTLRESQLRQVWVAERSTLSEIKNEQDYKKYARIDPILKACYEAQTIEFTTANRTGCPSRRV